ncbi:MAG: hypothetical protein HQL98_11845 [Magnetococcales bacterium]|nr:hypothetical protein [Magnetococcales bacterium]
MNPTQKTPKTRINPWTLPASIREPAVMPTRSGDMVSQPTRLRRMEAESLPYPWNNWNQEPSRSQPDPVDPPPPPQQQPAVKASRPAVAAPLLTAKTTAPASTSQPPSWPVDPVPVFEILTPPVASPAFVPAPLPPEPENLPLEMDLPALLALPVTGPESLPPPPFPVIMPDILLPAPEPETATGPVPTPDLTPTPEPTPTPVPAPLPEPTPESKPAPLPEPTPESKPAPPPEPTPESKPAPAPIPKPEISPFPVSRLELPTQTEPKERVSTTRKSRELSGWWKGGVALLLFSGMAQAMWGDGLKTWFQMSRPAAPQHKPTLVANQEMPSTVAPSAIIEPTTSSVATTTSSIEPTTSSVATTTSSIEPTPPAVVEPPQAVAPQPVEPQTARVTTQSPLPEPLSPAPPAIQPDQADHRTEKTVQPQEKPARLEEPKATPFKRSSEKKTVVRSEKKSPPSRQATVKIHPKKVLSQQPVAASVITNKPALVPASTVAQQEEPVHFVVAYGCFSSLKEVEGRQERIKARGWPATLSHYAIGQTVMNCLYGGPFRSAREADRATELFEEKGCLQLPKIPLKTP